MTKKIFAATFFIIFLSLNSLADNNVQVYTEKNKFGLKSSNQIITEAKYSKLIRLKDESYICMYKNKYGIISKDGDILVEPIYTSAQRFIGKYAKFGLKNRYVLFDEHADLILDDDYMDIALLYGKMFLVKKNYKYGITTFEGDILLAPIADDIYMPKANVLKISIDGQWYEITYNAKDTMELPLEFDALDFDRDNDFTITKVIENPVTSAGYGVVSISDYFVKVFSSISPAYEETIDELVLSHGADTASVLMKSTWLVKFPATYAKNYINTLKTPNNGPFSNVKTSLKNKIK